MNFNSCNWYGFHIARLFGEMWGVYMGEVLVADFHNSIDAVRRVCSARAALMR